MTAGETHDPAVSPRGPDLSKAVWKKSSYSGGDGSCVEVADLAEHIAVRDSKDKTGPRLVFEREEWQVFLEDVKARTHHI